MRKLLFLLLGLLLLTGCAQSDPVTRKDLYAMDTLMSFQIYTDDSAPADACIDIIQDLEAELSATDPDSALYRLNRDGAGDLSPRAMDLLTGTLALSDRTGGTLDPTVYPLVQLWGFPGQNYRVPTADELAAALPQVDWQQVRVSGGTVTLVPGSQLDLGAVTKGYAGQLCAYYLADLGLAASLNLGGNLQTVGTKPDGTPWQIGISHPEDPSSAIAVLSLTGTNSVVTSGDYQRCFTQEGRTYHHILDPATGYPADTGLRSVTIVAQDGLLADGLSTALFVMGLEEAADFWRQSRDFEAVLVDTEGQIFVTAGLRDAVSNCDFTVIEP